MKFGTTLVPNALQGQIYLGCVWTYYNPQLNFSFDVEDGVLKELSDSTDESYELTISTDVANGVKVVVKANTYFVGSYQKH